MTPFEKTINNLDSRGIEYTIVEDPILDSHGEPVILPDGTPSVKKTIRITNIPPMEAEVNRFFSPYTPCWFAGCEKLREEYNAALEAVGSKDCTGCQKGAIMRRFEGRVREAIKRHEGYPDTRPGEVPGSVAEGKERPVEKTSVLRRAADGLAQIFSHRARERKDRT